ncbi:hypothetical protein VTN02DRAFT_2326 [Thermoascus thermophilus]
MFQRMLLRQGQIARSALSVRSTSASPLTRASPLQQVTRSTRRLAPPAARRFYSSEAENNKEKKEEEKKEEAAPAEEGKKEEKAEDPVQKELEEKKLEVIDLKDKYLRSVADFRNLQERTKRDIDAARTFAIQKFAQDLLETVDNFERALSTVPAEKVNAAETEANKDLLDLYTGLKMTENILLNTLKKHGLERFDPGEPTEEGKPQKFDPNRHEATFMAKAEGKEDGEIMYVQSKGYILNGRVLRAAKVGVVKNA